MRFAKVIASISSSTFSISGLTAAYPILSPGIDNCLEYEACRVVGRIYDNCSCIGIYFSAYFFDVYREILVCLRSYVNPAMVFYIIRVIYKMWRKNDDLLTRVQDSLQNNVQRPGSAGCHDNMP